MAPPTLRADYSWIRDEGYREKGADALNLDVDSRTTDSLILGLDAHGVHLEARNVVARRGVRINKPEVLALEVLDLLVG